MAIVTIIKVIASNWNTRSQTYQTACMQFNWRLVHKMFQVSNKFATFTDKHYGGFEFFFFNLFSSFQLLNWSERNPITTDKFKSFCNFNNLIEKEHLVFVCFFSLLFLFCTRVFRPYFARYNRILPVDLLYYFFFVLNS